MITTTQQIRRETGRERESRGRRCAKSCMPTSIRSGASSLACSSSLVLSPFRHLKRYNTRRFSVHQARKERAVLHLCVIEKVQHTHTERDNLCARPFRRAGCPCAPQHATRQGGTACSWEAKLDHTQCSTHSVKPGHIHRRSNRYRRTDAVEH